MESTGRTVKVGRNRFKTGYLYHFSRTARDLRTAARWMAAASELRDTSSALSTALEQASVACLGPELPAAHETLDQASLREDLLSLPTACNHSPRVVDLIVAASIATASLRACAGDVAAAMTRPALMTALNEIGPHPAPWRPRPFEPIEPPPHVTEAVRLLATPAGQNVIRLLADVAGRPPLRVEELQPWWTELRAAPRRATQFIAIPAVASSTLTRELIWIDLVGTLPSPPLSEVLADGVRHTLPEAALDFREWAETLVDHAWLDDPRLGAAVRNDTKSRDQGGQQ